MPHALVTGGAGFIGSSLIERLIANSWDVTAIDNFDSFYDPEVKSRNLAAVSTHPNFRLIRGDIREANALEALADYAYDAVFHLAAKAGVRPSIQDPIAYQEVNVGGTQNLLELARKQKWRKFIFASSSSVYGINPRVPWREDDSGLMPISPYASTKLSGEFLGHVYSHLFDIQFIGLRFFTVYGPRQRPDLAIHKFTRAMLNGEAVALFGDGSSSRDYTYIDDIVDGIIAAADFEGSKFEIINLGNNRAISLLQMVEEIGTAVNVNPRILFMPDQAGDVPCTRADISKAERLLNYHPRTSFRTGLESFVRWLAERPDREVQSSNLTFSNASSVG